MRKSRPRSSSSAVLGVRRFWRGRTEGKLPPHLLHTIDGRGEPHWTDDQLVEITDLMAAEKEADALAKKAKAAQSKKTA